MPNQHPRLEDLLFAAAESYRRYMNLGYEQWAIQVDAAYCACVSKPARTIHAPELDEAPDADTYRKLLRSWDQTLRRYERGEQRMPVELMEAWVEALDEPWRTDTKRSIAQRLGMVGAEQHDASPEGDHESWGDILQTFGGLTERMGRILSDGAIDADDRQEAQVAKERIRQMQAELVALEHQLDERAGPNLEAV